ncbi:MAG: hypothetical protein ACFFCP_19400 [Promethearchaeota archaeon]
MNYNRLFLVTIIVAALIVLNKPVIVSAHNPTSIDLEYDDNTDTLLVNVNHPVPIANLPSHYIYNVVVEKNSVQVVSKDYVSEDNTITGLEDSISVSAVNGDILTVTARCTQLGIKTVEVTLPITTTQPDATTSNGSSWLTASMLIAVAAISIGVVAIVFMFLRRR